MCAHSESCLGVAPTFASCSDQRIRIGNRHVSRAGPQPAPHPAAAAGPSVTELPCLTHLPHGPQSAMMNGTAGDRKATFARDLAALNSQFAA